MENISFAMCYIKYLIISVSNFDVRTIMAIYRKEKNGRYNVDSVENFDNGLWHENLLV